MEGIDIDSIVRKAVAEYRRQEREHVEATAAQSINEKQRELECRFGELACRLGEVARRVFAIEDVMQHHGRSNAER
jgi:hypothetical protein